MQNNKTVVITGIGLLSAAGENLNNHKLLLDSNKVFGLDSDLYSPFFIHQITEDIDYQKHIPVKSDLRQMSTWQKLGVYAAGKALEDASLKNKLDILEYTDIIVASGGGERDINSDEAILKYTNKAKNFYEKQILLNKALQQELRPTLFLAQLSNLLAGNIAINNKIHGRSISLLGEDLAGANAVEQAKIMIETSQSKVILVGASFFSDNVATILNYQLNNLLEQKNWRTIENRVSTESSLILGNGAAFLVLEELEHALNRKAKIYGTLKDINVEMFNRNKINYKQNLLSFYKRNSINSDCSLISAINGEKLCTALEMTILSILETSYVSFSDKIGYMQETQFLFAMALAILNLEKMQNSYVSMIGLNTGEAIACMERI